MYSEKGKTQAITTKELKTAYSNQVKRVARKNSMDKKSSYYREKLVSKRQDKKQEKVQKQQKTGPKT